MTKKLPLVPAIILIISFIFIKLWVYQKPATLQSVCSKGGYESVYKCGNYYLAGRPCCDQGGSVFDKFGRLMEECTGGPSGKHTQEEGSTCWQLKLQSANQKCQYITCTPSDRDKTDFIALIRHKIDFFTYRIFRPSNFLKF